jgi:excisionase family DNA binding protein
MSRTQKAKTRTAWMSRVDVAEVFQVAPVTIGRWASQGKLPYALTLGGRRRFPREDILAIARQIGQLSAGRDTRERRR